MTTKVKIEVTSLHRPVIVNVLRSDGSVSLTNMLTGVGSFYEDYVHSGQSITVEEAVPVTVPTATAVPPLRTERRETFASVALAMSAVLPSSSIIGFLSRFKISL